MKDIEYTCKRNSLLKNQAKNRRCTRKSTRRNQQIKNDLDELKESCQDDDRGYRSCQPTVLQLTNGVVPRFEYRALSENSYRHLGTHSNIGRSGVLMTSLKNQRTWTT